MPIVVVCEPPNPPFQAGPQQETLSPLARGEHLGASATSKKEAQRKERGTKMARFLLFRSLSGLSWKKKELLHKTKGWYSMLLKKDHVGGVDECRERGMNTNGRHFSSRVTSSSRRIPDWPHVSRSSSAWDQKFSSWSGSVPSCPTVNLFEKQMRRFSPRCIKTAAANEQAGITVMNARDDQ